MRIRALTDHAVTGLAVLATVLVVAPLVAIFIYLVYKGASSLNLDFFTQIPKPVGESGGGMANAIGGSAMLLGLGSLIGVPIGIGGGIFLAEFGRGTKLANAVREAALALGVPNWRSVLAITVKTASPGIITGCMLAFARVAGETAPLIFTAFGNVDWSERLNEPIAALPLQIYVYAISPYDEWHRLAWAGALVLIVLIVLAVSLVRYVTSRGVLKGAS